MLPPSLLPSVYVPSTESLSALEEREPIKIIITNIQKIVYRGPVVLGAAGSLSFSLQTLLQTFSLPIFLDFKKLKNIFLIKKVIPVY